MMYRSLMLMLTACVAMAIGAAVAAPPSDIVQKTIAGKLDKLDVMVTYKWWDRAGKECAIAESLIKSNSITNPATITRVTDLRKAIDAALPARPADPGAQRLGELIARVQKSNPNFPDRPTMIRVRPDGSGDVRTVAEALARSTDKDVIDLATGSYTLSPGELKARGKDGKNRACVFFAPRGEWPRLTPAKDADFTLDAPAWLDGVEVVAGAKAIASAPLTGRNCYFRAAQPPPAIDQGSLGLPAESDVVDSVLQNFRVGLALDKGADVSRTLFVTCLTGVSRDHDEVNLTRCAFYRCPLAIGARRGKAELSVFSRCRNVTTAPDRFERADCLESDDPFADPFKGNFRLRGDVRAPGKMAESPAGPGWSDDRWEMFRANYNRPVTDAPVGLSELRDGDAARALAEARKAATQKDYPAAATALADVLGKFATCPSIRGATDLDTFIDSVVDGINHPPTPADTGDPKKAKEVAALIEQANAAAADGKKDDALALARKAVEADDTAIEPQQLAAELLIDLGRPAQAEPFLKRANELIEANADKTPPAVKARQGQLQGKVFKNTRFSQDWQKLQREQAAKYAELVGSPGPPSTAMAYRRALLLAPDNPDYKKRLAVAESLLQPVTDIGDPDAEKAGSSRAKSEKEYRDHKYDNAIARRRDAFKLDPSAEDVMFLSKCYQKLVDPPRAATFAVQARGLAASMKDSAKARALIIEANDMLRNVDPPMLRIDQFDKDFIALAELRRKAAEAGGDKDTADQIGQVLDKLPKLNAIGPAVQGAPAAGGKGN
ncbi:MAG: hypothetical protein PHU85_08615 [Phycisphaerae bacterium]|nr:hypothetical protein [Phycisphaerae bacterium]